ncbi:hypothetical protein HN643_00660 [Candidatus Falkowbacteria bacterium]|nr:hypothetical protein [Candidatus Falkowbacteria bacterium]
MRKFILLIAVFCLAMVSASALAQPVSAVEELEAEELEAEEPEAEEPEAEEPEAEEPEAEEPEAEEPEAEEATPADEAGDEAEAAIRAKVRKAFLKGNKITGGSFNVNVNSNELYVPDEMTIDGEIGIRGEVPIRLMNPPEIEKRSWCARHPIGCTFIIIGVTGVATAGGFWIADECGAFDRTNTIIYK